MVLSNEERHHHVFKIYIKFMFLYVLEIKSYEFARMAHTVTNILGIMIGVKKSDCL